MIPCKITEHPGVQKCFYHTAQSLKDSSVLVKSPEL